MKKSKIFVIVMCVLLLLGFIFMPTSRVFADSQTFTYTGVVSSDSSSMSDYGITSIESFGYKAKVNFHFVYDSTGQKGNLDFLGIRMNNASTKLPSNEVGIRLVFDNASPEFVSLRYMSISASSEGSTAQFYAYLGEWPIVYFFIAPNSGKYNFDMQFLVDYSYTDNLNHFIDMQSDSTFYNLFPASNNNLFLKAYNKAINNINTFIDYTWSNPFPFSSISFVTNSYLNTSVFNNDFGVFIFYLNRVFNFFIYYGDTLNISLYDVEFVIHRPTTRVNNTLIIYNHDYSFLSTVHSCAYQLRKGDNFYNVVVNEKKPIFTNSFFNYVGNIDVSNRVFDEYIFLQFNHTDIGSNALSSSYFLDNFYLDEEAGFLKCSFGFDFNFTYYNQPLVASNGSFNYTYKKPTYVDMPFSLAPFYIPVFEIVENALIFLMFYCPIIKDILALLHFDVFFGGIISVTNFILNSFAISQFLSSVMAFIFFYLIFKTLMPLTYSVGVNAVKDSQLYFNIQQRKMDKKSSKYLNKQFNRDARSYYKQRKEMYSTLNTNSISVKKSSFKINKSQSLENRKKR